MVKMGSVRYSVLYVAAYALGIALHEKSCKLPVSCALKTPRHAIVHTPSTLRRNAKGSKTKSEANLPNQTRGTISPSPSHPAAP